MILAKFKRILILASVVLGSVIFYAFPVKAAVSETITLNPGWNSVSVPRVLDNHVFSVTENSQNFDIYLLNASSTSGWSTMSEIGQTEFLPLFGYFINNKTSANQTLTFNYRGSLQPNERLFERGFGKIGWYSIGIANPQYAKTRTASTTDSNNVTLILNYLTGFISPIIDFTVSDYPANPASVRVGQTWGYASNTNLNSLNDLRETKGYAVYVSSTAARYSGYQNVDAGKLQVFTLPNPPAQNVVRGSTGVLFAVFELNAGVVSSDENIAVSKITVTDLMSGGATTEDIRNLAVYNAGAFVTSTVTKPSTTTTSFVFSQPVIVPKNGLVNLSLVGDLSATSTSGSHTFYISTSSHITAVGATSALSVIPTISGSGGQPVTITSSGNLAYSLASGPSGAPEIDRTVVVGSDVAVFGVTFIANIEPVKLTSLSFVATGTSRVLDVNNVRLYFNGSSTPFKTISEGISNPETNSIVFNINSVDNILPQAIQPGLPVTIFVRANIGNGGGAVLGSGFKFAIASSTSIVARGVASGTNIAVTGSASALGVSYINPFNISLEPVAPLGEAVMSQVVSSSQLVTVKITNDGYTPIRVSKIKFTDSGIHTGNSTSFKLYYSDQYSTNFVANSTSTAQIESTNFDALNIPIGVGAYRYFTLGINDIGASTIGDSFIYSVSKISDIQFVASEIDLGYDTNNSASIGGDTVGLFGNGILNFAPIIKL